MSYGVEPRGEIHSIPSRYMYRDDRALHTFTAHNSTDPEGLFELCCQQQCAHERRTRLCLSTTLLLLYSTYTS